MLANRTRRPPKRTWLELDDAYVAARTEALPSRAAVPGWRERVSAPATVAGKLRAIAAERRVLDQAEAELVDVGRRSGMAWGELGQALGVSGERARQRHAA